MQRLIGLLDRDQEFRSILRGMEGLQHQQVVYGLSGSQKGFVLAALMQKTNRPFLVVTHSEETASELVEDISALLPNRTVTMFPVLEWLPYQVLGRSREIEGKRLTVLEKLLRGENLVIVTTVQAVERLLVPKQKWTSLCRQFQVGEVYELGTILQDLLAMGYERVDILEGPGQFALRGGILDIFPLTKEPLRLEFFDNELDTIRIVDPSTLRSTEQINKVNLVPARELPISWEEVNKNWAAIKNFAQKVVSRLTKTKPEAAEKLKQHLGSLEEKVDQGVFDQALEQFLGFFYPKMESLFDYLLSETVVILDEAMRLKEYMDFTARERAEEHLNLLQAGQVFIDQNNLFLDFPALVSSVAGRQTLYLSSLPRQVPGLKPNNLVSFTAKPIPGFIGRIGSLVEEITALKQDGYGIALLAGNQSQAERLRLHLADYAVNVPVLTESLRVGQVGILPLNLHSGFQLPLAKLAIITESEIYKQEKRPARRVKKGNPKGSKLTPFVELKPGDFVVHANHGIGKYLGVERLEVGDIARDYFLVKYAGEDKLYVPYDQVHLLQKYLGGEGQAPKLSRMGGSEWVKVKNKVKSAVKDMAEELLKLYAEREKTVGFSFSPDSVWQKEFEDKFPYEETTDQLQCIREVKQDMVSPRAMDRVVCGDVGYGKTEVAIRAAFKAVMDSKQVAILVPTTILAQQHFVTFSERFADYPIAVEMLSRFRSPKEQKAVIEGLKDGSVDIVIGTHRLVSDDINFKELGLLIVDEEQRFGVAHKEKLKRLKQNVDVLTLSATPIPRTLHMSLVNIRDMSVIETPPEERYPVQTYVVEFSQELIRDVIRRELNRSGQVFYVHNRIQDLDKIVADLRKLVPEARVNTAHGQMREDELEQVMIDFMEKRFDVLVCTTIIETGLDLPNVNTLIVSEANNMGLSQLYQLRGRVGRSNRRAFAYFLYRRDKMLTEVAEKRLSAIRDFTEFGSGFKIAMRDLELRGAGNLLGGEQHGHMAAVGFDMYCKLLEQAVLELKGEQQQDVIEPSIEININAYFDDQYIADSSLKMDFYQRLMNARSTEALDDITAELIDRFGDPSGPVQNLLAIVGLRVRAIRLGIGLIAQEKAKIKLKFARDPGLTGDHLMNLVNKSGFNLSFSASEGLEIILKLSPKSEAQAVKIINQLLETIIKIADK